jgi:putative nucleotidyltransferase with HDIG domain
MARRISIGAIFRSADRRRGWLRRERSPRPSSPRFVSRVLAASFVSVFGVLAAMTTVLLMQTRGFVERGATDDLAAAQRQLAAADRDRHQDAVLRATLIAVNQDLTQVLEAYQDARAVGADGAVVQAQLLTLQRRLQPVASVLRADVMAIVGWDGRVIASAGGRAAAWPPGMPALDPAVLDAGAIEALVPSASGLYAATVTPISAGGTRVGHLVEGRVLDAAYAASLAGDTSSHVIVLRDGRPLAARAPAEIVRAVSGPLARAVEPAGVLDVGAERYAYLRLRHIGPASAYAVASITAGRDRLIAGALPTLVAIACGGLLLCAISSVWLAERVAAPIDQVTGAIRAMMRAPVATPIGVQPPSILELDQLTESFNLLMGKLLEARSETEAACLGAIGALAAALDARDPYTAGHSERVCVLSLEMGVAMGLPPAELETLRLGALLHDIGKIGIGDAILGKPSPLTAGEFETIKRHTVLGAHILAPVAFLRPHIPIVELHHERPDGTGYPYGLRGDDIPLLARIVHVADAYDAMTTARAYRTARAPEEALAELAASVGTDFDPAAFAALETVVRQARRAA